VRRGFCEKAERRKYWRAKAKKRYKILGARGVCLEPATPGLATKYSCWMSLGNLLGENVALSTEHNLELINGPFQGNL